VIGRGCALACVQVSAVRGQRRVIVRKYKEQPARIDIRQFITKGRKEKRTIQGRSGSVLFDFMCFRTFLHARSFIFVYFVQASVCRWTNGTNYSTTPRTSPTTPSRRVE
jgi:hypothetical protein